MPAPALIELPRRPDRLLVLATTALDATTAHRVVDGHPAGDVEVLVVAPAIGGRLERWTSDDRPRRAAEDRLRRCLAGLRAVGVTAEGVVGDDDALLAVDDALRLFAADEILVATPAERHARHRSDELAARARRRYAQRVRHVVVELADSEAVAA